MTLVTFLEETPSAAPWSQLGGAHREPVTTWRWTMSVLFREQQGWLQLGELAIPYSFPVRLEAEEPESEPVAVAA
jgi:hypothetical protein